jgi:putative phosphoribosyl transferase
MIQRSLWPMQIGGGTMAIFRDRADAGRKLATRLSAYGDQTDVVVLALPRGGVPVGFEVARALGVPLDVFLVRKLGVPGHEELAMGAIASGGVLVLNADIVTAYNISDTIIEFTAARERAELEHRETIYRGGRSQIEVQGKCVILVDDGLATGASMRAAVAGLRAQQPSRIIVAVPTAPSETCLSFQDKADEVVCLMTPEPFRAVGMWYSDFSQTTDREVQDFLERADTVSPRHVPVSSQRGTSHEQPFFAGS